jgi:elongation factor Ts
MAQITATMVRDLREKTGAGMMDCKKALNENEGDMDASVKFLREKGLAAAAKKAGRVAAEGLTRIHIMGNTAALVEVNCETDFVAKTEDFQNLVADIATQVATSKPSDVETLLAQAHHGGTGTVSDLITAKISTIGENLTIRRFSLLEGGNAFGSYLHMGGNIGVLIELSLSDGIDAENESVKMVAKDLAMQIAASQPQFVRREEADAKSIEEERSIYRQQGIDSGKPENIVEKIVDGRINKWFGEVCLLEQVWIKDTDMKINKLLAKVSQELGGEITVNRFDRYKVGEGIEKRQDDLAAEVAKMTQA